MPQVNLQGNLRSMVYRVACVKAYMRLRHRAEEQNRWLTNTRPKKGMMNSLLVDYIQGLYSQHETLREATHTILGVQLQHWRRRGHLKLAWDYVTSWKLMALVQPRPPLPVELLWACVIAAMCCALIGDRPRAGLWWTMAVARITGIYALLRPGELAPLRVKHLLCSHSRAVITITNPKTRRAFGRHQFALIDQSVAVICLSWLAAGANP